MINTVPEQQPAPTPTRRSYLKHCTKPVTKAARKAGLKSSVMDTLLAFASFAYTYPEAYPCIGTIARKRNLHPRTVQRHKELILASKVMTATSRTTPMKYSDKNRDTSNVYEFKVDGFITKAMLIETENTDKNATPDMANCHPVRVPRVMGFDNTNNTPPDNTENDVINFDLDVCSTVEQITASGNVEASASRENIFEVQKPEQPHVNSSVASQRLNSKSMAQSKTSHRYRFAVIVGLLQGYEHIISDSVVGRVAKMWRLSGLSEGVIREIITHAKESGRSQRGFMSYIAAAINQRSGSYSLTGISANGVSFDNLNRLRQVVEARKSKALPNSTIVQWSKSVLVAGKPMATQVYVVDHAIAEGWDMIYSTEHDK